MVNGDLECATSLNSVDVTNANARSKFKCLFSMVGMETNSRSNKPDPWLFVNRAKSRCISAGQSCRSRATQISSGTRCSGGFQKTTPISITFHGFPFSIIPILFARTRGLDLFTYLSSTTPFATEFETTKNVLVSKPLS